MVALLTTLTAGFIAFLLLFVLALDDWLGVLAFKYQYLAFCLIVAGALAAVWFAKSRRASLVAGLTALAFLVSPYFLNQPSSRILRGLILDVPVGTDGDRLEKLVANAYHETGYVMPRITRDDRRVHVSLLSQEPGDCTAAVFYLANGVVVNAEFSAD